MSDVLGRLASQAIGGSNAGRSSVRPASSVHAQTPLGTAREVEEPSLEMHDSRIGPRREPTTVERSAGRDAAPSRADDARTATVNVAMEDSAAHSVTSAHTPERHHFVHHDTRTVERIREVPAPLLAEEPPPKVVPFTGTPMPAASRNTAQPAERREEATEVHVHIGRIEVMAAPEPAPVKKPRAAPRQTLPLADYLARKGRA